VFAASWGARRLSSYRLAILEAVTTSGTFGWSPTEIDGINLLQCNGLFDAGTPVQPELPL
jgi:hypothetical protein